MVSEKEKLKALLKHWAEHSLEHEKSFRKWAEKAEKMRLDKVSKYLLKAAEATGKAAEYLEKAFQEVSI